MDSTLCHRNSLCPTGANGKIPGLPNKHNFFLHLKNYQKYILDRQYPDEKEPLWDIVPLDI
jgi:hypothetical protein